MNRIKTLIVADSAIVRKLLTEALASEPDMEVNAAAPDTFVTHDKLPELKPDVVILDLEMPGMGGLTFLRELMQYRPTSVIAMCSLGTEGCTVAREGLRLGAVGVLTRPGRQDSEDDLKRNLPPLIRAAAMREPEVNVVIAIGASTGGAEAIEQVLMRLPANGPGIVITQHIPAALSPVLVQRLNQVCPMEVKEAQDGDKLTPGRALIAPGGLHMMLRRTFGSEGYRVSVQDGPRVCYQRPSVDVMFGSVAEAAGAHTVGVILTGMGSDGARGLLQLKKAGARTIAQDEASCVVFGMPREAIKLGAAGMVLPLSGIPSAIMGQPGRN